MGRNIWYTNTNKLIKAIVVLGIPIGILSVIFWHEFPVAKIILFTFLSVATVGILDRLLAWSLRSYHYRTRELVIFLVGVILGWFAVSNNLLPMIRIILD